MKVQLHKNTRIHWDEVEQKAKNLLAESDWTQLPDVDKTVEWKSAWKGYRQALRDIINKRGTMSVNKIRWPKKPEGE